MTRPCAALLPLLAAACACIGTAACGGPGASAGARRAAAPGAPTSPQAALADFCDARARGDHETSWRRASAADRAARPLARYRAEMLALERLLPIALRPRCRVETVELLGERALAVVQVSGAETDAVVASLREPGGLRAALSEKRIAPGGGRRAVELVREQGSWQVAAGWRAGAEPPTGALPALAIDEWVWGMAGRIAWLDASRAQAAPDSAASAPSVPRRGPLPDAAQRSAFAEEVARGVTLESEGVYRVTPGLIGRALDRAEVAFGAHTSPVQENQRMTGLRFSAVIPELLFGALGLQNGDVVRRIDDEPLARASQFLDLFARLQREGSVTLTVERGGSTFPLTWRLE